MKIAPRRWVRLGIGVLAAAAMAGCSLYSEVSIEPLNLLPTKIERGADVRDMVQKSDYLRAVQLAPAIEARPRKQVAELLALGTAELACFRLDAARQHLRDAIDLATFHDTYSQAAWNLSQVEFLANNFETSYDWAQVAIQHGLTVMQWHLDFLKALKNVEVYRSAGDLTDELRLKIGRPDVPRVDVHVNRSQTATPAVIDSGAVLSIVSERLASEIPLRHLETASGTFYGLLGEPIAVRFALLDSLEIGTIVLENVPVAIMPDDKMRFLVNDKREFKIDFLIGANLLKEFRTDFDFSRSRVRFTRLTAVDRKPADDQNLFVDGFRPVVRGAVNKHGWFMFVLDTGSEVTFLNEKNLGALPINMYTPRMHNATLQGLGGAKKRGARIDDVEIGVDRWAGAFRTLPMYSAGEQERAVGIIGENFLKNFNVTIDYGRMRVDLKRR